MAAWNPVHYDVVLSVQGGIGNQLFQWAYADALTRHGRAVLFDRVRCRGDRPFDITPLISRRQLLSAPVGLSLAALERASLLRLVGLRQVNEPGPGYHPELLDSLSLRAYVRGYFQSQMYFCGHGDSIRERVNWLLNSMLTPKGRELAKRIRDDDSVAVHIRRGDYLSDPSAATVHGVLSKDYYDRAFAHIDKGQHMRRIWFSDDMEWVSTNLAQPGDLLCPTDATTHSGGEIALMAACRTRVIANSSFSWWGGFLGTQPEHGGTIVAPSNWFVGSLTADDLVPNEWCLQ